MNRQVTISAVQLPFFRSGSTDTKKIAESYELAEYWLDQAGQRGADIASVGEIFNIIGLDPTGETLPSLLADATEQTISRLGTVARRHNMYVIAPIVGLIDNVLRNVALLLGRDGKHIGSYLKVHCTENERALGIIPGGSWPVFELDFGTIGIQICHDNSFPESARCLTMNGAEVIFWPHVMGGWGGEFMDILLRATAIHNGVYHVPVCYGSTPDHAWRPGMMIGRSSIIAPDATIVADAGRYAGITMARLDLNHPRVATNFTRDGDYVWSIDMLNDRRPDTYAPLVRAHTPLDPTRADSLI
jgi:predicted amidohydrolase